MLLCPRFYPQTTRSMMWRRLYWMYRPDLHGRSKISTWIEKEDHPRSTLEVNEIEKV